VAAEGLGPWLRSSILAIGQGRAGKTALTRNIAGQEFKDTLSTTGIEELSVGVQYANVNTNINKNTNNNNINNSKLNSNANNNNNNNKISTDDNNISTYGMWGLCEFTEGQELEAGIAMAAKKAMAANKSETFKDKDKDDNKDMDKVANSNISKEFSSVNKGNTVINNSPRQSSSASASSFFVPSSIESNANNNVSSSNSTNVSIYIIA